MKMKNKKTKLSAEKSNPMRNNSDGVHMFSNLVSNLPGFKVYRICGMIKGDVPPEFQQFTDLVHIEDRAALLDTHRLAKSHDRTYSVEFRLSDKNGDFIHIQAIMTRVTDDSGLAIRLEGTLQDITERKRVEKEMQLEKQLSDNIINSLPGIFYTLQ